MNNGKMLLLHWYTI